MHGLGESLVRKANKILTSEISDADKLDRLITIGLDYEDILEIIFEFTTFDQGK